MGGGNGEKKKQKSARLLSLTLHCTCRLLSACHGAKEEQTLDWGCRPLAIICFCAHTEFRDSKVVISHKTQKHHFEAR